MQEGPQIFSEKYLAYEHAVIQQQIMKAEFKLSNHIRKTTPKVNGTNFSPILEAL